MFRNVFVTSLGNRIRPPPTKTAILIFSVEVLNLAFWGFQQLSAFLGIVEKKETKEDYLIPGGDSKGAVPRLSLDCYVVSLVFSSLLK
ncbi:hypothetical protein PanWU01x14_012630 [Parasponia andersonii]|uniref:Uncharacterized protein n=1 Tax=Parasponia andersonii TaxID=3476 RepID=A0A2P5E1Y6_PARAD|nr:hypothetical protein PanWU01x14_012630 [Parasponia andersonii]